MILFRNCITLSIIAIVSLSFSQCASILKLQDTIAVDIGEVYYQSWVAGVKEGGSGINIYIPIKNKSAEIVLDSVYFKRKGVKLEETNPNLYIGRFSIATTKPDIVMTNKPFAEYGNKAPKIKQDSPFDLKEDECVLSFTERGKRKYYKITGIIKNKPIFYPSTPSKKL
ncbi:hypothetical protein [Aestuariivivens sp. NBU2969]|uniref:hypothetical protein n=1 Tax=Aestuariivivens sp. NBU2969 TaxID=2873267 RepID=UPI001CBE787F|nr:hypothetical protein [Aestuariivivens sp. NBU2969]